MKKERKRHGARKEKQDDKRRTFEDSEHST